MKWALGTNHRGVVELEWVETVLVTEIFFQFWPPDLPEVPMGERGLSRG